MRSAHYERLEPAWAEGDAVLHFAERVSRFAIRDGGAVRDPLERSLPPRHRAAINAHDGCFVATLFSGQCQVDGVEFFVENASFVEAARRLYGRPLVRPVAVTANLMLPGQRVALHTDVPEFRGICRDRDPAWLSIAMHHSGFFDDWRIACATCVAWFGGEPQGGDFVFYPDGPYGRPVAAPVRHDTAIALDTDSVFHGVDPPAQGGAVPPPLRAGMALRYGGDGAWILKDGEEEIARYAWADLRFSMSWRARCYRDDGEERKVREHKRDLTRERALRVLADDLRARGRIGERTPDEADLARMIVEEYIKFPPGAPSAASAD